MNQLIISIASLFFIGNFSTKTNEPAKINAHDFHFPYAMENPISTLDMPIELEEISGLSLSDEPNVLLANNDEQGKIFIIDKTNGEVLRAVKFHKKGDYEGIEKVGSSVFVVKSTGTIYEIKSLEADSSAYSKYKFFLNKCFDTKKNRLLLACKGKAGEGEAYTRTKAVYAFDIATKKMMEEPVFLITLEDVCNYLGHCTLEAHVLENLNDFFDPKGEVLGFSPSSISIHPKTGHLYLTSSKGKMILVLNEKGKILHIEKLKKSIHPQPEGLCFEADGTMWISNESKKDKPARIYKFAYQP